MSHQGVEAPPLEALILMPALPPARTRPENRLIIRATASPTVKNAGIPAGRILGHGTLTSAHQTTVTMTNGELG